MVLKLRSLVAVDTGRVPKMVSSSDKYQHGKHRVPRWHSKEQC